MVPQDDNDVDVSREAWLAEPFTERMRARLDTTLADKLDALLGACRTSLDANVAKAFIRYEGTVLMKELFKKGVFSG